MVYWYAQTRNSIVGCWRNVSRLQSNNCVVPHFGKHINPALHVIVGIMSFLQPLRHTVSMWDIMKPVRIHRKHITLWLLGESIGDWDEWRYSTERMDYQTRIVGDRDSNESVNNKRVIRVMQ